MAEAGECAYTGCAVRLTSPKRFPDVRVKSEPSPLSPPFLYIARSSDQEAAEAPRARTARLTAETEDAATVEDIWAKVWPSITD